MVASTSSGCPIPEREAGFTRAETTPDIQASVGYLTNRLAGTIQRTTLWRHTRTLRTHDLVQLLDSRRGLYRVPALSDDELRELEHRLGVGYEAPWNRRDANYRSLRRDEDWPTWDLAVELAGGI